jgi:hypothetical protein
MRAESLNFSSHLGCMHTVRERHILKMSRNDRRKKLMWKNAYYETCI